MKKIIQMITVLMLLIIPVISIGARTKTYDIIPNEGYRIVDVIVNGVSQGPITEYTFTEMAGKQTLKVITAKIEEGYTVTFDANGGSGTMNPQIFEEGIASNLVLNTYTREGYAFNGWSTTAGGTVAYADGANYTATANATLYAVWQENAPTTYTVTFNANGGTGAPTAQTKIHGTNLTLSSTVPTRDGFTFLGWSTSSTAISEEYTAGGTYTTNANVTLYAVWEVALPSIDEIPLGSYIQYTPSNTTVTVLGEDSGYTSDGTDSGTPTDQIYYPQTYTNGWKLFANNGNGQIDIISAENVLSDSSGTETTLTLQGLAGYANAVDTLNTLSEGYINPEVAYAGRSIGAVKGSSQERIDQDTMVYGVSGFPYDDTLYTDDQTIINTAVDGVYPLRHSSGYTWLASRYLGTLSSDSYFIVRYLSTSGSYSYGSLYNSASDGTSYTYSSSNGVRPVISLKAGMEITGGSGTKADPYILTNVTKTVNDLTIGGYIQYSPSNTSITMLSEDTGYTSDGTDSGTPTDQTYYPQTYANGWKVFKNTNGQIDIISAENVLTDSSGTETTLLLQGKVGYANAVDTLNTLSEAYINPTYATAGRSIGAVKGSSQERIDPDTCTYTHTYTNGNNGFPYTDTLYSDDQTIINTAVDGEYPLRASGYTWLASRNFGTYSSGSLFHVRCLDSSGSYTNNYLYYSYSDGSSNTYSSSDGVRPVISLKSGLTFTGSGTEDDPYVIVN